MKCSICEKEIPVKPYGWSEGHNAWPITEGRCCDQCNRERVIPARLRMTEGYRGKSEDKEESDG
jgi:hypothetical protein